MKKYEQLISWLENIKDRNHSSAAALFIMKDNQIVLEYYSGTHSNTKNSSPITATSQFNVASARKSYLGLGIAYALYEGKIRSLDDYAVDYFEEYDKTLLSNTTLRHLVTHSHGLNASDSGSMYREFEPGEEWAYRGINVEMMTQLIYKLYNKSFPELLRERVFIPAGFTETAWQKADHDNLVKVVINPGEPAESKIGASDDGTESNLFVSAREFAYWGNLHLNKGYMNGKQIIPKEVIEIATQVHSPHYKNTDLPQNGLF